MQELSVALIEPEYEANIGFVSRTLENFGLNQLILVNPKTPIGIESRTRSMHGVAVLENARVVPTTMDALEDKDLVVAFSSRLASDRNLLRTAITPKELRRVIQNAHGKIVLMFGRESSGLTNEEVARADILVSIPANPSYPVLNLSHAVAIVLYELYQREEISHIRRLSSIQERDIALRFLEKTLPLLGLPVEKRKNVVQAFKNMFGRSLLSHREVTSIIGYFHRVYTLCQTHSRP